MATQTELQELRTFIGDRLTQVDRQIDEVKSETAEIKSDVKGLNKRLNEVNLEIAIVKNNTNWIKWLFGFLASAILILLSIIITVLFKLVN